MHTFTKFLAVFLIVILTFCTRVFANDDEYIFDPLDPHHFIYIPDGEGPFPAILLLHGSAGIEAVNDEWATLLKNNGYVVYMIDSFKPRGFEGRMTIGWDRATAAQLSDIVPAYHYLSRLPYVNAKRIGILGFSLGGFDVLRVMSRADFNPEEFQKLSFKAAASFYGVCHRLSTQTKLSGTTTIFIGLKDDRAAINDCLELVKRSAGNNKSIQLKTYADALHSFDNFKLPASKEIIDERGEHYHIGYDAKARQSSIEDLLDFFDQQLKN